MNKEEFVKLTGLTPTYELGDTVWYADGSAEPYEVILRDYDTCCDRRHTRESVCYYIEIPPCRGISGFSYSEHQFFKTREEAEQELKKQEEMRIKFNWQKFNISANFDYAAFFRKERLIRRVVHITHYQG